MLGEKTSSLKIKKTDNILPIHKAQLLTYLRMSHCRLGYLLNWNTTRIVDGIRRKVYSQRILISEC